MCWGVHSDMGLCTVTACMGKSRSVRVSDIVGDGGAYIHEWALWDSDRV